MFQIFSIAAVWMALALVSAAIARRLKVAGALSEILVGVAAAALISRYVDSDFLCAKQPWLTFITSCGAVMLTFLAGSEINYSTLKTKWKEVIIVGIIGFLAPFLGCAAVARFVLGWSAQSSWLAGIALSTTSMAVVYAVMIEFGFNKTEFGKGILAACFVNDLGTVLALGFIFAPFTYKTAVFFGASAVIIALLPFLTNKIAERYAFKTAAIRTKWILFVLFGLGALALWADSEAILPAYVAGMVLSGGHVGGDKDYIRRLRTMTVGFFAPIYFLRAGSLVSLPALVAVPMIFFVLLAAKTATKIFGLYPVIGFFRRDKKERWYYTLLMSTGLTFGTISALYGFSRGIIDQTQYSHLVAVVIGSAVFPTLIANALFLPRHLLALGKTPPNAERT